MTFVPNLSFKADKPLDNENSNINETADETAFTLTKYYVNI